LADADASSASHPDPPRRVGADSGVVVCDLSTLDKPDLGTIDSLARLQLCAGRGGCTVRLRGVSPELRELLTLVGLDEIVGSDDGSDPGMKGEAEEREQPGRVQEVVPDDSTG